MAYPLDQLPVLTKANLDLSFRLAEITRQGTLKATTEAFNAFAEAMRSGANLSDRTAALSSSGTTLLNEGNKIREQMLTDARAAFEQWQTAWSAAFVIPENLKMFGGLPRFWENAGAPTSRSDGKK